MPAYQVKQSTTAYPLVFLMVDSTDHVTGKTGLSPTVTISKSGGSFASPSGAVTEIANGWYKVAGNATDSATLGPLALHATGTGADPTDTLYEVVAYDPQDAVRQGLTSLPNAAAEASGGLYTRGSGAGQINQDANGRADVNLKAAAGTAVTLDSNNVLNVSAKYLAGTALTGRDIGTSVLFSAGTGTGQLDVTSGRIKADTVYWNASAVASPTNAGYPLIDIHSGTGTNQLSVSSGQVILQTGTGTGQLDFTSGVVKANATQWLGGTIPAVNVTGVPLVDAKYLLGTVFSTPATAGIIDVNLKNIANAAVSASTAQLGVNVVNWTGTVVATPNTAGVPLVDHRLTIRAGTAQSTGNTTTAIKLDSGASATTDFYKYYRITVISGTGSPESAICTAYNGSTKVATVAPAWPTAPDNTSVFLITTDAQADVEAWGGTAPNALQSGRVDSYLGATGSVTVTANTTQFAGQTITCSGGVTIPAATLASTTNITSATGVDVTKIDGSAWGTHASGMAPADVRDLLGTAWATPNTAGLPDVNVKQINAVSTSSVTTVSANVGTTQPVNFTGTGASALAKSDMVDIAGSAVATGSAQLGVNVVNFGGSAGTFASGRPEVNMTHIAGSSVSTSTAQIGVNVVNYGGSAGTFSGGRPEVNAAYVSGVLQTAGDLFAAVTNIAVTSAALNATASGATITTGTQTNTYTSTSAADGTYHSVADSAGTTDFYYQFDLSGTSGAVGVGVFWLGYLAGAVNTIKVYAYNWGGSSWDQIGTITGIAGTVAMADDWELTSAHTGTGGNAGLVRIRFNNTGLVSSSTKTDRILLGYAVVPSFPTNFTSLSIDSSGRIDLGKWIGTAPLALSSQQVQAIVPDTQKVDLNTIKTQTVTCAGGVTVPAATLASTTNITSATGIDVTKVDGAALATHGSGYFPADVREFAGTTYTDTSGRVAAAFSTMFNVASPVLTVASVNQTGDSYARLGAPAGASIAADLAEIEAETDGIAAIPTSNPSAAVIATAVWQDTTAGDFTVAGSIGKSLFTSGAVPGAASGLLIAGSNAATTFATLTSTGAFTVNGVSDVAQTGDNYARIGATGSGLTSLAPSSTALSTATWTAGRATNLDNLDAAVSVVTGRLTSARADYLDNLNVGGNVASSSEVTAIQNNTRVVRVVPDVIELPASSTRTYRVELFLYDETGNMEAPDSAPTVAMVNQSGTDRSSRLDSTTMALVETGRYRAVYTSTAGDTKEQLVWTFSVVEGGATRKYGNSSDITDAIATDFTSSDRTLLTSITNKLPSKAYFAGSDNSSGAVEASAMTGNYPGTVARVTLADTLTTYTSNTPQSGDAFSRIGAAGAGLTALGDARVAHLDADVSSRTKPADTQAAVTTVTNLTNAPTAGDFTATMKTSLNAATPAATIGNGAITSATFAAGAITAAAIASGAISRATFAADTGLQTVHSGTAQSGTATTIRLASGASSVNGFYQGYLVKLTGGTGAGQRRVGKSYAGATRDLTVEAWTVTPDSTTTYAIDYGVALAPDGLDPVSAYIDGENGTSLNGRQALCCMMVSLGHTGGIGTATIEADGPEVLVPGKARWLVTSTDGRNRTTSKLTPQNFAPG